MRCETGIARPTGTCVEGGVDVGFTLWLPDGSKIKGECTLVRRDDGCCQQESWRGGC